MSLYRDRYDAGRVLATKLVHFAHRRGEVVVLGLPRGGVPVAYEVARAIEAPFDVFVVRKLGVPGHEELAMGAIADGGVCIINQAVVDGLNIPERLVDAVVQRERLELDRRERQYRDDEPPREVRGRVVILVDDGLATGSSMRAAIEALRAKGPESIVVAVPVAPPETVRDLREEVDEVVCAVTPDPFYAVGMWFQDFAQVSDDEVRRLLKASVGQRGAPSGLEASVHDGGGAP